MVFKIPLAWLQLIQQKGRFIVAVAGMAFIVLLMFVQLGFQDALYSSATAVHQRLQGDLFLVSSQYKALTSNQSFPRARLYQALGFETVESVSPMYLEFAKFRNEETGEKYPIYVIGVEPGKSVINLPEVEVNMDKLKIPDVILFDKDSRPYFGNIPLQFSQKKSEPVMVEVFPFNNSTGYRVRVGGLFSIGPSFGVDGNLIVSDSTFLRIFASRPSDRIDLGVITLKQGADPEKVLKNLRQNLPSDVRVFTKLGFNTHEKQYWAARTPIGFILNLMLTMGSIVGIVIVYQILYSNISSQFVAYATLKAIGYKNNYLLTVVFQQAIILAILGYLPGFILSLGLYDFAMDTTKLPIMMTFHNATIVFVSTIFICVISGILAINKLRLADPADIF